MRQKLSACRASRLRLKEGFSLIEVVIALSVVAFALIAMLGVMSTTLVTHEDASVDSVFTVMTESAMQEIRNVGFVGLNPASAANSKPLTSGTAYYIYFDGNGQITVDGTYQTTNSGTSNKSYEVATTNSTGTLYAGVPLTVTGTTTTPPLVTSAVPSGTVYVCKVTVSNPTLSQASTATSNMFVIKMVFSWPANAPVANQKTRTVVASLSNTN